MSTKFFTNENENTLLHKIEGIFQYRKIHFFDALVGYFRASGYFQIRKFIENTAKIRILVGINVDRLVYEAERQGLLFSPNFEQSQEEFFEDIKKNIQEAKYDKEVEDGMYQFIKDIVNKKIELKVHPRQNIHAKIYIFREEIKHEHGYGSVITGSSNLTDAGLKNNFEFNVELRANDDLEFATETFEKLWAESVEIDICHIEQVKKETYLNDEFTPYEIYLKFLVEYFGKSIEFDPNSVSDLPKGFKRLSYQIDAVNDGFNKMLKHGGFFLADVVGLGKTIVAALIAKRFFYTNDFPSHISKTLIIVPPALKGSWEETLEKFKLENYKIITNGSIHKITKPENYDLIIVDEAHKFRTDTAEMYNELQKLCKTQTKHCLPDGKFANKKIILISATPLNNKPEDIANLVYLFQNSKDSTLEISNLQHFFREYIDRYKLISKEKDTQKINAEIKYIYEKIRTKIIEPLTVRRTRTDLAENEDYKKDLDYQDIKFPHVRKPEKVFYQLEKDLDELYDKTILYLSRPDTGLTYNRYQAIRYLVPEKKRKYRHAERISVQLASIMKTLLVKRIDSSFYAFKSSLKRFADANRVMLQMFQNHRIYIAPNLKVNEFMIEDREDELLELLTTKMHEDPTIEICTPDDFDPSLYKGLLHDQRILDELVIEWDKIQQDPKLDIFINYLNRQLFNKEINPTGKLVVFSESKETTHYLTSELKHAGFTHILNIESSNRKDRMPLLSANFDANIPLSEQKNDYNIVIATEVLAEGVNMHRANIIVNYDTPWNSTRLMQRIGRVNRIGSAASEIFIFNFFPTSKVEKDIELEKKARLKLAAFHAALGEDSQIYSPDEQPETFGLFDKILDEERDEKLYYLMWLRKLKEENPTLIKRIKAMPFRARTGRKSKILKGSTLTFIRNKKRDAFNFIREDGSLEELTFLEAVKEYEANPEEKSIPLHNKHHEQVVRALDAFAEKQEAEKAMNRKVDPKQGPNEKKALIYLDAFLSLSFISDEEKTLIIAAKKAITIGKFQKLQREINNLQKVVKKTPLKPVILLERMIEILQRYPLSDLQEDTSSPITSTGTIPDKILHAEIIISESFNI